MNQQHTAVSPPPLSSTARTQLSRKRDRGRTDRHDLYSVLDAALVCHLGLVLNGSPVVLPTGYGRDGETIYLHGSTGAGNMRAASDGVDVCVTVTLLDGIVYSRSINDHSMNYRCAVIHGKARPITERAAKLHGLRVLTEHLAPGSWEHARAVNNKELASVTLLALDLTEASVKVRDTGPSDEESDVAANTAWAGVLPVSHGFGAPVPAADLPADFPVPAHIGSRSGTVRPAW